MEEGILEQQSLLLISSVKKWFENKNYQLHGYSPRANCHPCGETLKFFVDHGVQWHSTHINDEFNDYPIANKVLACRDFENKYPEQKNILFVDTDTVFLADISEKLLNQKNYLYLRPVDNKGPGSESETDPNDEFWQKIFKMFSVDLPKPTIRTSVRPSVIRNYFNAGFIWSNGVEGFFEQWYEDFMRIIKSKLRPSQYTSRDGSDFRCLDQVALAVTATRITGQLSILPETYNYPIPFRPYLKNTGRHLPLEKLIHLHYHKWFQHAGFLNHILTDQELISNKGLWLKSQTPLKPQIDTAFKC